MTALDDVDEDIRRLCPLPLEWLMEHPDLYRRWRCFAGALKRAAEDAETHPPLTGEPGL